MAGNKRTAFIKEYGADDASAYANDDVQGSVHITDLRVMSRPVTSGVINNARKPKSKFKELKKMKLYDIMESSEDELDDRDTEDLFELPLDDPYTTSFTVPTKSSLMELKKSYLLNAVVESNVPLVPTDEKIFLFNHSRLRNFTFEQNDEISNLIWNSICNYHDLTYCMRKWKDSEMIRLLLCTHVANHILKSLNVRKLNNKRLKDDPDVECRDQGFSRCSIMYLCPFKNSAKDFVDVLISILPWLKCRGYDRFLTLYGSEDDYDDDEVLDDFCATFRGNVDDSFAMGIKFTNGGIKLLCTLAKADIIIASPVAITQNEDMDMLLSSVEILIVDQASDLRMQNWDNVESIFSNLNNIPQSTATSTDIMRVKSHFLDGEGKSVCQTIVLSDYLFPQLNTLFRNSVNIKGKIKVKPFQPSRLIKGINQVFVPIHSTNVKQCSEARFSYFKKHILSTISSRTVIVVPHYYDYTKLRNYMDEQNNDFEELCEYTNIADVNRARTLFFNGKIKFLLYTERLWYYKRSPLKGAEHILFYSPPETVNGYRGIVKWIQNGNVTCLYCKYDYLAMERIIGTERVARAINLMNFMQFS
eukprot:NODE_713_length_4860_cov_0.614157.p1 type:complete len:588 gc:universal NODE_713_length_4860_cov_0.614157:630-2393(+)